MALESKPLFHPEVIRQQVRAFNLPERVGDWQPKLQHWAGLIASGRADDFKETALLPDFHLAKTAASCPPNPSSTLSSTLWLPVPEDTSGQRAQPVSARLRGYGKCNSLAEPHGS